MSSTESAQPLGLGLGEGLGALVPRREDSRAAFELDAWKVQVFGERCSRSWEISVVRESNKQG